MGTQKDLSKTSATQAAQVVWAHWPLGQMLPPEACRVPRALEPDDTVTADYGLLDHVRMTFFWD